ncbi:uncharacterized protein LOC142320833 [Lycorma delicatula]|uniref:uncharacterized protein LOC142320833 n=1 Tax=Lycorma delicatula TaxID=130591 RepID=UPI003F50F8B5
MESSLYYLCVIIFNWMKFIDAQVTWTPIYVDGNSQVDLWTQKASGCPCPYDSTQKESCACCVQDGGCHCGEDSPHRCSQCGLQQYCTASTVITNFFILYLELTNE